MLKTLLLGYAVLALVKALDVYGIWRFYRMTPHIARIHRLPVPVAAAFLGLTWPLQLLKLYIRREDA